MSEGRRRRKSERRRRKSERGELSKMRKHEAGMMKKPRRRKRQSVMPLDCDVIMWRRGRGQVREQTQGRQKRTMKTHGMLHCPCCCYEHCH